MRLDKMWDCGQNIWDKKSVMKLKHYNSATSFVPWKKDYPTSQQFFPPYPKEEKKDCPISPHNSPPTPPHPQDACDLKGFHIFSQHLIWD